MIDYQPGGQDTLSKMVRGEVTAQEVRGIVDPNYVETPTSKPSSVTRPEIEVRPTPETVEGKSEPTPPTPPTETLLTPETLT
jgi:hypothetical protein